VRMPQNTPDEQRLRHEKMQAGLKSAIKIPLNSMRLGDCAWNSFMEVARFGNPASRSDTLVGARALEVGIWGAYQNVLINMEDIEDEQFKEEILHEAQMLTDRAEQECRKILDILGAA